MDKPKAPETKKPTTTTSGAARIDSYKQKSAKTKEEPRRDFSKMNLEEIKKYFGERETKIGDNSGLESKVPVDAENAKTWVIYNFPLF